MFVLLALLGEVVVLAVLALLIASGVFVVLVVLALLGVRFLFPSPDDRRHRPQQHQQEPGHDQVGP